MNIYVLIIWVIIAVVLFIMQNGKEKYRLQKEKIKVILIITIGYYVIYVLTGLKTGYSNTPYSHKPLEILKNLIFVVLIRIVQEYVRTKSLNRFKNIYWYIFLTIVFIIIQLDFNKISSLKQANAILEYILSEVIPTSTQSVLLTYLSINGGYILNTTYILPDVLFAIISPIFPELDWFFKSVLMYIREVLTFLFISFEDSAKKKISKRTLKKENPIKNALAIMVVIIITCFVTGVFPYRPVAIISNSMYPNFSRGDLCIIKNISQKNIDDINIGDIIQYKLNNISIIHRVIEIHKEPTRVIYITKGDNNSIQDLLPVEQEQIVGKVAKVIKYLGFPSVWFSESFLIK